MTINWTQVRNIAAVILVLVLLYHFWDTECDGSNSKKSPDTLTVYKFRVDTVEKVIERPPLIGQGKAKIVYRDRYMPFLIANNSVRSDSAKEIDTSQLCFPTPFIAKLDSVQGKDSVHLEYLYPESVFRYSVFHKPDTLIVYDTTKTITNTINTVEERPWYTQPMAVTGFTLTAIILLSRLLK